MKHEYYLEEKVGVAFLFNENEMKNKKKYNKKKEQWQTRTAEMYHYMLQCVEWWFVDKCIYI